MNAIIVLCALGAAPDFFMGVRPVETNQPAGAEMASVDFFMGARSAPPPTVSLTKERLSDEKFDPAARRVIVFYVDMSCGPCVDGLRKDALPLEDDGFRIAFRDQSLIARDCPGAAKFDGLPVLHFIDPRGVWRYRTDPWSGPVEFARYWESLRTAARGGSSPAAPRAPAAVSAGKPTKSESRNQSAAVGPSLESVSRGVDAFGKSLDELEKSLQQYKRQQAAPQVRQLRSNGMCWNFEGDWHPSRAEMIDHLAHDGIHRGRYTLEQLHAATNETLIEWHDADHNGQRVQVTAPAPQKTKARPAQQRARARTYCPTCPNGQRG